MKELPPSLPPVMKELLHHSLADIPIETSLRYNDRGMMMSGSFMTAAERYRGTERPAAATPEPMSPQAADLVRIR